MRAAMVDYDVIALSAQFERWGFKAAHARTVLREFYAKAGRIELPWRVIGKELAGTIEREIPLRRSSVAQRVESGDGTVKLLAAMGEGGAVEAVLMPGHDPQRAAGCVSSQVGCAMGCDFCASTRRGLERNLEAGEIVEQFLHLKEAAAGLGRRLRTIVFMGMGEPMHNLDNVLAAVKRIADPDMGNLGWRQVTISTVGIVPGIYRLMEADLNVHLALSLHGADDQTRSTIVPMNRRYPIVEIMEATKAFFARTKRVPTIEYCLLAGINDSDEQAEALANLLEGCGFHVNLIPYNPIGTSISGVEYRRPTAERVRRFMELLWKKRIVVHVRAPRGDDVNAACGQLRERSLVVVR